MASVVALSLVLMVCSCASTQFSQLESAHPAYDSQLLRAYEFTDEVLAKWPNLCSLVQGHHFYEGDAKRPFIGTPYAMEQVLDAVEQGNARLGQYLLLLYLATHDGESAELAFERDVDEYKGRMSAFRRFIQCREGDSVVIHLKGSKSSLRQAEIRKSRTR